MVPAAAAGGGGHRHWCVYRMGTSGDFTWGCDVPEPFEFNLERDKHNVEALTQKNHSGIQGRASAKECCTSSSWSPAKAKLRENIFAGTCIKKKNTVKLWATEWQLWYFDCLMCSMNCNTYWNVCEEIVPLIKLVQLQGEHFGAELDINFLNFYV